MKQYEGVISLEDLDILVDYTVEEQFADPEVGHECSGIVVEIYRIQLQVGHKELIDITPVISEAIKQQLAEQIQEDEKANYNALFDTD